MTGRVIGADRRNVVPKPRPDSANPESKGSYEIKVSKICLTIMEQDHATVEKTWQISLVECSDGPSVCLERDFADLPSLPHELDADTFGRFVDAVETASFVAFNFAVEQYPQPPFDTIAPIAEFTSGPFVVRTNWYESGGFCVCVAIFDCDIECPFIMALNHEIGALLDDLRKYRAILDTLTSK